MYELLILMDNADIGYLIAIFFAYFLVICLLLYFYDMSGWRGRLARIIAIIIIAVSCYYGLIMFLCM